jgi:hypothetical protein
MRLWLVIGLEACDAVNVEEVSGAGKPGCRIDTDKIIVGPDGPQAGPNGNTGGEYAQNSEVSRFHGRGGPDRS